MKAYYTNGGILVYLDKLCINPQKWGGGESISFYNYIINWW